jgi:hypothetical protein
MFRSPFADFQVYEQRARWRPHGIARLKDGDRFVDHDADRVCAASAADRD